MSKPRGKENKQADTRLEKETGGLKKELLEITFAFKELQGRLTVVTEENQRLEKENAEQFKMLNQKIEEMSLKNQTNQKRLVAVRGDLTNSEVQNRRLINSITTLEKSLADQRTDRVKEHEQFKKNHFIETEKYENMLTDYKQYMNERDSKQREIIQLIRARQGQAARRVADIADKERQKLQATDKLKQQMDNKMKQIRHSIVSIKKQQLDTTTRLTLLQNHQLNNQLGFQSKQTQRIVFENEQLSVLISKLKQQLDVHKQVEDQMAKRVHYSKGVIKKLNTKITQLEQELEQTKQQSICKSNKEDSSAYKENQEGKMIQAMDKQLSQSERKYAELITKYENLVKKKEEVDAKLQVAYKTKKNIFDVLLRGYSQIMQEKKEAEIKGDTESLKANADSLKKKCVQEWTKQEVTQVLLYMMKIVQPHLSKTNLIAPSAGNVIVYGSEKQLKGILPKISTDRERISRLSINQRQEDLCTMARNQLDHEKSSMSQASMMVVSKLREWGRPVGCKSKPNIHKYNISCSYRN